MLSEKRHRLDKGDNVNTDKLIVYFFHFGSVEYGPYCANCAATISQEGKEAHDDDYEANDECIGCGYPIVRKTE
jgi:hypothetical protein